MNKRFVSIITFAAVALTAGNAIAGSIIKPTAVPEIEALAGISAVAALAGVVALVRERMKR